VVICFSSAPTGALPYFAHENPDVPHDAAPALPNTDIFFSAFVLLHAGHGGCSFESRDTSSSYSFPQSLHLYSYIGIKGPLIRERYYK
jgi:hypothetical protein